MQTAIPVPRIFKRHQRLPDLAEFQAACGRMRDAFDSVARSMGGFILDLRQTIRALRRR